jgi:lipoyl(octanoyl) transferase
LLLLLEHTPVITLGRNAKVANVIASAAQLIQRGVQLFECDRGGDVTFHGPGQLVGYPIFDLRNFSSADGKRKTLGAVEYVRRLEEVLIRTCADFRVSAGRVAGLTGVWTISEVAGTESVGAPIGPETRFHASPDEAKIAAIGVHISRSVTSHGFALNVSTDLDYFNLIIPCGITSKPVTSMVKELGQPLSMQEVAHAVSRNFGVVFQSQMLWLETLDSLFGHSIGVPMKPPSELRRLQGEEDTFWV